MSWNDEELPDEMADELSKVLTLIEEGKKHKAMRKLRAMRNRYGENIGFRKRACNLARDAECYGDALEDARFLVDRVGDGESKLLLIDCLIGLERYQEAEEALVKFSDLSGKSASYHLFFGIVKMQNDREEEANEEFGKVFSVETDDEDDWIPRMLARLFMAGNFLVMRKLDEAREQARLAGREAREPKVFIEALDRMDSDIVRYEALSECVRIGKIIRNPEFTEYMERIRFSAEGEAELLMLQEGEDNL